jgi:hypothetical protein
MVLQSEIEPKGPPKYRDPGVGAADAGAANTPVITMKLATAEMTDLKIARKIYSFKRLIFGSCLKCQFSGSRGNRPIMTGDY